MCALTADRIERERSAIREADPALSELEVKLRWAEKVYGRSVADAVRRDLIRRSMVR